MKRVAWSMNHAFSVRPRRASSTYSSRFSPGSTTITTRPDDPWAMGVTYMILHESQLMVVHRSIAVVPVIPPTSRGFHSAAGPSRADAPNDRLTVSGGPNSETGFGSYACQALAPHSAGAGFVCSTKACRAAPQPTPCRMRVAQAAANVQYESGLGVPPHHAARPPRTMA